MDRDYLFYESTVSICPECFERVPAKILIKDDEVFLRKYCSTHGFQEVLFEESAEYFLSKREFDKPGTLSKVQTPVRNGCPFDCGLCPEHEQHTCIGLIEITDACNLRCPTCYANSGGGSFLSLDKVVEMLDFYVDSEGGEAEILQVSGGEPTLHPDVLDIIGLARSKNIRYVMLNTNGLRIAEDEDFVRELSKFKGGFEVYLQFDGYGVSSLRGRELSGVKSEAVKLLSKYEVPTTLVVTVEKGVNDYQLGEIVEFGMRTVGVRGVNFQPVAFFGRVGSVDLSKRVTLSGIVKRLEEQLPNVFKPGDILPLPCDVDRVAVSYLVKSGGDFVPVTRRLNVRDYLPLVDNTFAFDAERLLKDKVKESFSCSACSCMSFIRDITSVIPLSYVFKSEEEKVRFVNENTFRISVTSFVDVYNFDLKSVQKECVHIITPDLRKVPFSTYNMFYRGK